MKKNKSKKIFYLSIFGLSTFLYYMGGSNLITTKAVGMQWQAQADSNDRPLPIKFENGSFEYPRMRDIAVHSGSHWAYVPANNHVDVQSGDITTYVHGWNTFPLYTPSPSYIFSNHIEIQRPSNGHAPDGEQYVELNVDGMMYLSQSFQTTPGSRLYYGFEYKKRGSHLNRMGFVMKDENAELSSVQNLLELTATGDWVHYGGRFTVPENQHMTEIGFRSMDNNREGNLIDKVEVKTGAYLEVHKTSDRDISGYVKNGEYITYRLNVENFGETPASQIKIWDQLDSNVDYVGAVRVNGVLVPSTFDEQNQKMEIDLTGMTLGEINSANSTMEISYRVRAKREDGGDYAILHSGQATISYQDMGYESLPENAGGFVSHSNIYQLPIVRDLETTQMGVSLSFRNTKLADMAENVRIGLFRDEILVAQADLNKHNQYSHIFSDLEYEYLQTDSATMQNGGIATASVATSSDAILNNGLRRYRYDIGVLDGLISFSVERNETEPNHLLLIARYIYPKSSNPRSVPNMTRSTTSSISAGTNSREKNETEQKIKITTKLLDEAKLHIEGEHLHYEITVTNEGETEVQGIWIRDYISGYSNFVKTDSSGNYGVIDGREFGNWFIESLGQGQSRTLFVEVMQNYCLPEEISNEVKFKITDSTNRPWTNDTVGP